MDDSECDEHEYHIECKRLNIKKTSSGWDFCAQYINNGVQRYCKQIYGKRHHSGTMIGYIQTGGLNDLLSLVNSHALCQNIELLTLENDWNINNWTRLTHKLNTESFMLFHYWVDFRK